MKFLYLGVILISALLVCIPAFGLSQPSVGNAGDAAIWVPLPCNSGKITLLYYYKLGVCFAIDDGDGKVKAIQIFRGSNPTKQKIDDLQQVVPGVGAFGVYLDDVYGAENWPVGKVQYMSTSKPGKWPHYEVNDYFDGSRLYIYVNNNRVEGLVAYNHFKTPEGICEQNGLNSIMQAYGDPDVIWGLPPAQSDSGIALSRYLQDIWGAFHSIFQSLASKFLIMGMVFAGCMSGLFLRFIRRPALSGRTRVLYGCIIGAIGSAFGAAVLHSLFSNSTESNSVVLTLFPLYIAAVTGAAGTGIFEFLLVRQKKHLLLLLPAALSASFLAGQFAFLLPSSIFTSASVGIGLIYVFFVPGVVLTGR